MTITVATFYAFVGMSPKECKVRQKSFKQCMLKQGVRGTILVTHEGVNATISGSKEGVEKVLAHIQADGKIKLENTKYSTCEIQPFKIAKVKYKPEVIPMNAQVDPNKIVGEYVKPKDWNALIQDPNAIVIDTRNDYETQLGMFKGAVDPDTKTFKELPEWVENHKDDLQDKKIVMYCTGGVRCEKSTSYMKELGFDKVYHLDGGILKYLEEIPEEESLWEGDCYVFDDRVAVGHGCKPAEGPTRSTCCNHKLIAADYASPTYKEGVSCRHCVDK